MATYGYFTMGAWVQGSPTPGTSAIIADATGPGIDLTNPAASRIVVAQPKTGTTWIGAGGILRGVAIGGTSVIVQAWFYDEVLGKWVAWLINQTITLATSNLLSLLNFSIYGAKVYIQIVTVNGTVTGFGYDVY